MRILAQCLFCILTILCLGRVVRYRTLEEELRAETVRSGALRQALAAEDTVANASLYLLLRAVDRFQGTYHRFPGTFDGCAIPNASPLLQHGISVLKVAWRDIMPSDKLF